ncbi:MAG: hypothetical protein IKJ18_02980 [Bacteroidaceae bacterium]|nr:hypothetical protein [Bacteroidaceae bacterium]
MKKLIGFIFTLLVCGLVAPHRVADDGAERSVSEVACAVAATTGSSTTHHSLATTEDGSLALQRLLDEMAVIVSRADMAAGKTSAKNACGKWCRECGGRLREHSRQGCEEAAMYHSVVAAFARAIDHYVYAFRHIII